MRNNPKNMSVIRNKYLSIIEKWLSIRNNCESHQMYIEDEELGVPNYVAHMCREINNSMGGDKLSEVLSIESLASGHSDYCSKFSMYCAELELGV